MFLALAMAGPLAAQESGGDEDAQPLDLAAMLLGPGDVGAEGYGIFDARAWSTETKAADFATFTGSDQADELAVLAAAGYVHGHEQVIAVEAAVEMDAPQAAALIVSYLHQFTSAAGARDAYAHFEAGTASHPLAEEVEGTRQFGDASQVSRFIGVAPDTGVPSESIDLSFVEGTLCGGVTITLFKWEETDTPVGEPEAPLPATDVASAEALAERLLNRIERARTEGTPGLSLAVLRVDDPNGSPSVLDHYTTYGGEVLPFFGEPEENFTTRSGLSEAVVAVYEFERQLGNPYYVARLTAFETDEAAPDWLPEAAASLVYAGSRYDDVVPVETSEIYGDESTAVSYTYHLSDTDDVRGYIVWVRVGTVVARVQADAVPGAALEGVEALAQTQAACLEDGGPCDPIDPPASLVGD
jgi:hypothetical protein